ncbi:hypothetical protein CP985_14560 [Malaciobacter mytili LMG 24559]|uniref:NAD-dependent epimerase/dehydratase domain-containing protein n=1 Tax=Malaciobacter mytili LMG 24559 TaxID=1032238 RepID=A0AAX2AFK2_9BACT|nr:NAD(P)-dependent oxidoreductase [Malaciobacter mytili]AXH14478.1 UDP-glucose 4-epimerase [Malaciobacter mytili LMG 24559]RXK12361.1 hypothetical protein CP985_14560 [Malaciobacter mytili LMG 24559]
MSKIAILGSTGMIGSHFKALCLSNNIEFLDIDRKIWDLSVWKEDEELDELFNNVDCIFHFAAVLPKNLDRELEKIFEVNVKSCLNISKWALKNNVKIVFLSGSTVYADTNALNIKEDASKVVYGLGGFYGYSKLLAENIFNHYIHQGLKVTILRPSSVYGLGLGKDKIINQFINKIENDIPIKINQPENKINFIHSMDVSIAALQVYLNNLQGTFNIAAKETTSIYELAKVCTDVMGKGKIEIIKEDYIPFERFNLNCDKAKNEFNFKSRINIKDGIASMYNNKMLEGYFFS